MKTENSYWVVCNEVTEARKSDVETKLESFETREEAFAAADARGCEPAFYWGGELWVSFWDAFKGSEGKYCDGVEVES